MKFQDLSHFFKVPCLSQHNSMSEYVVWNHIEITSHSWQGGWKKWHWRGDTLMSCVAGITSLTCKLRRQTYWQPLLDDRKLYFYILNAYNIQSSKRKSSNPIATTAVWFIVPIPKTMLIKPLMQIGGCNLQILRHPRDYLLIGIYIWYTCFRVYLRVFVWLYVLYA